MRVWFRPFFKLTQLIGIGTKSSPTSLTAPLVTCFTEIQQSVSKVFEDSRKLVKQSSELDIEANILAKKLEETNQFQSHLSKLQDLFSEEIRNLSLLTCQNKQDFESYYLTTQELLQTKNLLQELTERIQSIEAFASHIEAVATESRLLAFNASIEAARAGVHGKSFAVVADQIKKLAEQSSHLSIQIKEIIQTNADVLNNLIGKFDTLSHQGELTSHRSKVSFDLLEEKITTVQNYNHSLSSDQKQQIKLSSEMNKSIESVSIGIQNSIRYSHVVSEDSERLKTQTENLDQHVNALICNLTGSTIKHVDPKSVYNEVHEYQIIDVRQPNEFNDELGHIKNAVLVTVNDEFLKNLDELNLKKHDRILFVCRSGGRSARACRLAQSNGYNNVTNLKGGMLAWNKSELPTA